MFFLQNVHEGRMGGLLGLFWHEGRQGEDVAGDMVLWRLSEVL